MIVTDRSRIETTGDCARKRYWAYEYGGWGIRREGVSEDLAYGLGFHEGAEVLARGGGLEDALARLKAKTDTIVGVTLDLLKKSDEYYTLGYGHLRTLQAQILPDLRARYEIVGIETEIVLPLSDDVLDMNRLDIGLKDKQTGDNYYVEWKTDANPSDIQERMQYNLQFVLGVATLQKALAEPVVGSIIIGVDKGRKSGPSPLERKDGITGERRDSPFTYAYSKDTGFGIEWDLEWRKGWKKKPVWSVLSVGEWYGWLMENAPNVPREQFVITPPLMWEKADFERMARQIVAQERRLAQGTALSVTAAEDAVSAVLDEYFPMNRKNCKNDGAFRKKCQYIDVCHGCAGADPLSWGYQWREENHPLEATIRKRPF